MDKLLQNKIIDFLVSLPNMDNNDSQRAFIYRAALDPELQAQIQFGKPPAQFFPLLVALLAKYGWLNDGRHCLEAILGGAKNSIGLDKRAICETILQEFRTTVQKQKSSTTSVHFIQAETQFERTDEKNSTLLKTMDSLKHGSLADKQNTYYQESKKKTWRNLDQVNYIAIEDNDNRRVKYSGQLALHLHRTFKNRGYTQFTSFFGLQKVRPPDMDIETPIYSLISQFPAFTGALRYSWNYLWNRDIPDDLRQKYQEELSLEFYELYQTWSLEITMPFTDKLVVGQIR